jgi:hypothetical protein
VEGPIIGDNQSSDGWLIANNMVEMERHPSVCLPSGAPTKLRPLEMRLGHQKKSRDKSRNDGLANPWNTDTVLKQLKNETQLNAKSGAITQRSCLCGSGFKHSYAMVGSSGNDDSILVDHGDRFGCFWPLFPLLVLHELRRTGWQARLAGISHEQRVMFVAGSYFLPR